MKYVSGFTSVKSYHRMQNTPKTLNWNKKKKNTKTPKNIYIIPALAPQILGLAGFTLTHWAFC